LSSPPSPSRLWRLGLRLSAAAAPATAAAARDAREVGGFMLDAHLAGMKAALKLTPTRKRTGPLRSLGSRRRSSPSRRHAGDARYCARRRTPSPIERMNAMADHLAKASTEIKAIAATAKPLYDSLDDGQRRHFGR